MRRDVPCLSSFGSVSQGQENEKKWNSFGQNFRSHGINQDLWKFAGDNPRESIKQEPEGLLLRNPPAKTKPNPLGIVASGGNHDLHVQGDFEITVSYELMRRATSRRRRTGFGAGWLCTSRRISVARTESRHAFPLQLRGRILLRLRLQLHSREGRPAGSRRLVDRFEQTNVPTKDNAGKLRLGATGAGRALDLGGSGRQQRVSTTGTSSNWATTNTNTVRVTADSVDPSLPVEVRIREFEIRAASVPQLFLKEGSKDLSPAETPQKAEEKGWLLLVLELLGLVFTLALVSGLGGVAVPAT